MGEIADDMINGLMCSLCGIRFEKEHGYPVVCKGCWKELFQEQIEATGYQKAIHQEL